MPAAADSHGSDSAFSPPKWRDIEVRCPSPDNDACFSGGDSAPSVAALSQREFAVHHSDHLAKQLVKALHHLRCERNFRHQKDHLFATLKYRVNQADKYAGLSAAGDAMQQKTTHPLSKGIRH